MQAGRNHAEAVQSDPLEKGTMYRVKDYKARSSFFAQVKI